MSALWITLAALGYVAGVLLAAWLHGRYFESSLHPLDRTNELLFRCLLWPVTLLAEVVGLAIAVVYEKGAGR